MKHQLHKAVLFLATLMVVVVSAFSATQMAPDRSELAFAGSVQLGFSPSDICGGGTPHEQHRCPFCHLDPNLPAVVPTGYVAVFRPSELWRQLSDLHLARQTRRYDQAPRAPPVFI